MHRAVVLPSPLLPARAYAPLAHALGRRGWGVVVADVPPMPDGPDPVLAAFREVVTAERADLVVAHSNAGRYAVAAAGGLARRLPRRRAAAGARRRDPGPGGAARPPRRPGRRRRAAPAVDPLVGRRRPRRGRARPGRCWPASGPTSRGCRWPTSAPGSAPPSAGSRTRRPTSRSATPTPRRPRSRASRAGPRRCSRARCTCTTSSTRMPWPPRCSTSRPRLDPLPAQDRAWSRGDDHGVTGRGTATPSSSRSVRSE